MIGLTAAKPDATPYRYDKQHLVPFGEFIPTGFRWFTTLLNIPLGDFMRGVRNYVGTAWEVNDTGAVLFSRV